MGKREITEEMIDAELARGDDPSDPPHGQRSSSRAVAWIGGALVVALIAIAVLAVMAFRTSSDSPDQPVVLDNWATVGSVGIEALDDCAQHRNAAVMYACINYRLIDIDRRIVMGKGPRDIRHAVGSYLSSYAKYWATHECGTPSADSTFCEVLYRDWLDDRISAIRSGFEDLRDGKPL